MKLVSWSQSSPQPNPVWEVGMKWPFSHEKENSPLAGSVDNKYVVSFVIFFNSDKHGLKHSVMYIPASKIEVKIEKEKK